MARPFKAGLDYYPLDTNIDQDDKIGLIEAKYGLIGFAIIIKLFNKIYSEGGYYCKWNEDIQLLFSKRTGVDYNLISEIINDAVRWEIFDKEKWEKYKILTSKRIQKTYIKVTARRKEVELIQEYLINGINVDKNTVNVCINSISACNNTQRKEKKSKVKKSKVKNNTFVQTLDETKSEQKPSKQKPSEQKPSPLNAEILGNNSPNSPPNCETNCKTSSSSSSRTKNEICFNFNTKSWENITKDDLQIWKEAYPACNIEVELNKMRAWILSAGSRGKKRRWRLFINNWLSRQQDKGGTIIVTERREGETYKQYRKV